MKGSRQRFEQIRIVIILVLGMMALGFLTWGIGKVYLELVGHSSVKSARPPQSQEVSSTSNDAVLVLPEAKFWTCQVGLFQNESNAQSARAKLQALALNAQVLNTKPWMVGVGLGNSADELKGLRQFLAEKGIQSLPKQIVLPKQTFRVTGNGSQLTVEMLTNVNSILQKGVTTEALAKEEQVWAALAGEHPPKELEVLHELYGQLGAKNNSEAQSIVGLALYFQYQRIINEFSGK